jgi:superfamily II DNA or RNA helicase
VSSDLVYDAERDLRDIGADEIQVHELNRMKYAKISGPANGSIKKGVIFSTYTSLVCKCRQKEGGTDRINSRFQQLIQWCGKDFDGLIVFDECHHAKNLMPSTGTVSSLGVN